MSMRIPAYLAALTLAAFATFTPAHAAPQPEADTFQRLCPAESRLIRQHALPYKASTRSIGFTKPTETYLKIDDFLMRIINETEESASEQQAAVAAGTAFVVIAPQRTTWALFGSPRPDIPCSQLTNEMPVDDKLKAFLDLENVPPTSHIEQAAAKQAAAGVSRETTGAISPVETTDYAGTSCENFIRNEIIGKSIDGNAILLPLVVQNDRLINERAHLWTTFKGGQKTTDIIARHNLPAWYIISFANSPNVRKSVAQQKNLAALKSYTVHSVYATPQKCMIESGGMKLTDSSPPFIQEVTKDFLRHAATQGAVVNVDLLLQAAQFASREQNLLMMNTVLSQMLNKG